MGRSRRIRHSSSPITKDSLRRRVFGGALYRADLLRKGDGQQQQSRLLRRARRQCTSWGLLGPPSVSPLGGGSAAGWSGAGYSVGVADCSSAWRFLTCIRCRTLARAGATVNNYTSAPVKTTVRTRHMTVELISISRIKTRSLAASRTTAKPQLFRMASRTCTIVPASGALATATTPGALFVLSERNLVTLVRTTRTVALAFSYVHVYNPNLC